MASAETRSRLEWRGRRQLVAKTGSGHEVRIDTAAENGGDNSAAQPLETFMTGMGACSAVDVLSILEKMRFTLTSFALDMDAPRREEHPRVWREMHLTYELESPDATPEGVRRAVMLSLTRYCSATAMVRSSVPAVVRVRLNGEELEPIDLAELADA
jgi:putative redox protein